MGKGHRKFGHFEDKKVRGFWVFKKGFEELSSFLNNYYDVFKLPFVSFFSIFSK
jgi:hypothetical protein